MKYLKGGEGTLGKVERGEKKKVEIQKRKMLMKERTIFIGLREEERMGKKILGEYLLNSKIFTFLE